MFGSAAGQGHRLRCGAPSNSRKAIRKGGPCNHSERNTLGQLVKSESDEEHSADTGRRLRYCQAPTIQRAVNRGGGQQGRRKTVKRGIALVVFMTGRTG